MKILSFEYESFIYTSGLLGMANVTYKPFFGESKKVAAIHKAYNRTVKEGFYVPGLWYDYSTGEILPSSLRTKLDKQFNKLTAVSHKQNIIKSATEAMEFNKIIKSNAKNK